jgi:MFS family permease
MFTKQRLLSLEAVGVLRHPSFARFTAAQLTEDAADSIYLLVLPWLVLEAGGSGVELGLTGSAAVLPFLVIGPVAGVVVDRLNRALVMIASNVIRAAALSTILLVGWLADLETWHLASAAFILTAADVVAFTARGAVTPTLVPREELVAANTVRIAGGQVVNIGGKAAAGFLMFAVGSFGAILVSIGLYFVSMLFLFSIRAAVAPPTGSLHPAVGGKGLAQVVTDLAVAVVFVVRHPVLRALAFAGVVINAAQYPLMGLLLPVLFENVLEAGPRGYGLFLAAASCGVFIAMLVAPRVAKHVGEGRLGGISLALWGVGLGLLAVVGDLWPALILGGLIGFIGGGLVPMGAFAQSEVPDEMRGRVGANLMAANLALVPVTFILAGFLIDSVGPRPLYALSGLIVVACGLALIASRAVRDARLVPNAPVESGEELASDLTLTLPT